MNSTMPHGRLKSSTLKPSLRPLAETRSELYARWERWHQLVISDEGRWVWRVQRCGLACADKLDIQLAPIPFTNIQTIYDALINAFDLKIGSSPLPSFQPEIAKVLPGASTLLAWTSVELCWWPQSEWQHKVCTPFLRRVFLFSRKKDKL